MAKTERFGLVLSSEEKLALQRVAERERISAAAVIRRLIWKAAQADRSNSEAISDSED
jgi:hypothetical protein